MKMIQRDDIFLNEVIEAIKAQQAPSVDVLQNVMGNLPALETRPSVKMRVIKRVAIAVAACFMAAVAIDLSVLYAHDYDEAALGNMLSATNDLSNYFDCADYESSLCYEYASLE